MMQENLKKAFLRGISAMNMQAMGIFTTEEDLEQDLSMMEQSGKKDNEEFVKNTSLVENHPMGFSRTGQQNLNQSAIQSLGQTTNNSFIPGKPRIESKDHKWK